MTNLLTYRWRKRLMNEISGRDQEMPWIDELAADHARHPELLDDLLAAIVKLPAAEDYIKATKNLSWYVAMEWPIKSNASNETWSRLLDVLDDSPAGVSNRALSVFSEAELKDKRISYANWSKEQLQELLLARG